MEDAWGKAAPPNENRARINIHGGGTNHHHMLQALSSPEPPLGLLHCMYAHLSSQRLLIPEEPTSLPSGSVIVISCFVTFTMVIECQLKKVKIPGLSALPLSACLTYLKKVLNLQN